MGCFAKRVCIGLSILFFCAAESVAQLEAQLSQYVFFPVAFNPAMVGESGKIQIAGVQRMEFLSFAAGGQSTNFGVNLPLGVGRSSHGVGLRLMNRTVGSLFRYQNAFLQYAYKREIAGGRLSAGIDLGFINISIDGTKVVLPDEGEYHESSDPAIPRSEISGMAADINIGLFYSYDKISLGASLAHLNRSTVSVGERNKQKPPVVMYLFGMYRYDWPGKRIRLYPTTMLKTYFLNFNWDVGGRFEYDEKFWGGLSYRFQNAVVFNAGMNIGNGISAGFAYDLPTTRLVESFGSVEIFLAYEIERDLKKQKKKYKSVRIL